MQDTIFYVGGGKGGVGKSIISTVLTQYLIDNCGNSKTVHLIETDESNPDVGRIYDGKIPITPVILDEREVGWITLFEVLEKNDNTLFVVNSAARSNRGIEKNGENFCSALREQDRYKLVTLWPINRQVDSANLLIDYLQYVNYGPVFVVRNLYWGEGKDFVVYDAMINKPKYQDIAQKRINAVLDFPALNDLVTLQFYSYSKTIPEASAQLVNILL